MKRITQQFVANSIAGFSSSNGGVRHNSTRPTKEQMGSELREDVRGTVLPDDYFTDKPLSANIFKVANTVRVWAIGEANKIFPFIASKGYSLRWKNTCLYVLPNIRRMKVSKLATETMLKWLHSISWVSGRKVELWGWRNRKHNKYIGAMYSRLKHARCKQDLLEGILLNDANFNRIGRKSAPNHKYWNLAYFLMTHSVVFQVIHMNKVLSNKEAWSTKVSFDKVLSVYKEIKEKFRDGSWMEVVVTRVWIDDNKRPLGVPTLPDRVIGSMLSNLLEFYLWNSIKYNHAYQCGRGTGTAWKAILTRYIFYPWIWEFDLDGCFNKLSHQAIISILRAIDLPSWLWISLTRMQKRAPVAHAASGSEIKRTVYGQRVLEEQRGKTKQFFFWDKLSSRGVAQGHSLSPLISVIVIEHAIRSWLSRPGAKGWAILMYADDGLVFAPIKPDWYKMGQFLARWGMYISIPKSGFIREDFKWVNTLKFLGLKYDPFKEKFMAWTRKGSRVILETSKTVVFEGGKYIGVEDGIFYREGYQDKLGQFIRADFLKASTWVSTLICTLLLAYFDNNLAIFIAYAICVARGWIGWEWALTLWGLRILDINHEFCTPLWCLFVIGIIYSGIGVPSLELTETTHLTQQITWRLVLRGGLLNQFIARLYNKSLADKVVPQDFKLQPEVGSLIWHVRNTVMSSGGYSQFLEAQGLNFYNWITNTRVQMGGDGPIVSERIEEDLENRLNVFNASTVGTYLLIKLLGDCRNLRGEKGWSHAPSPYSLYRRLLDKFHLNGWWWAPPAPPGIDPATGFKQAGGIWRNPSTYWTPTINSPFVLPQKPKPGGRPLWKPEKPIKLLAACDWLYLLTDSWLASVSQTRHRWYMMWPYHLSAAPIATGRVYRSYRLHVKGEFVHGWVPIIRRKMSGLSPVPGVNHKFPIVVQMGGTTLYEERSRTLFGGPRKRRKNRKSPGKRT